MKRPVDKKKPPVKNGTLIVVDRRGFVPSPFGGRVRRIPPVD